MEKNVWMMMEDNVEVYVKKWYSSIEKPKAIVQLSHGMAEHINRYNEIAKFLVKQGIFVYGNDHRGHGRTGEKQGIFGYFAEEDGFTKTVHDQLVITKQIKQEHPNTPIFLFGHSMGSFLAREYIQQHSHMIDGVMLSGTGYFPKTTSIAGRTISSIMPPKEESKLMNSFAFGSNNKKIGKKLTSFDWLSNDEEVVETYINDPYTGFIPTGRFFYDLLSGLLNIHNPERNDAIRNDLPMLLISGDADPIGDYSKGIWKTAHLYEKAGLKEVMVMLFTDGRHELLHEMNKDEVHTMIHTWIHNHL
ncbi:alpha-beta hydrolase superfamily lysophospholipase [Virgibacillus natechei]|uniref:Alpha-beta hydrolase superfamily lysophospholipase n=1 Tax=Virgibacillus natechei TaxID=1216297 RepID=A0ABS4IEU5_9BACI|nr:alpha/beta hydrolase [Virgibacillus natechei]MBP1969447.1 alpha-beta hydrolase superfamily lysophospholipase [Virgibacillus natechei]UZD11842.1 lysophospholipase [Virgibacillus natechei]